MGPRTTAPRWPGANEPRATAKRCVGGRVSETPAKPTPSTTAHTTPEAAPGTPAGAAGTAPGANAPVGAAAAAGTAADGEISTTAGAAPGTTVPTPSATANTTTEAAPGTPAGAPAAAAPGATAGATAGVVGGATADTAAGAVPGAAAKPPAEAASHVLAGTSAGAAPGAAAAAAPRGAGARREASFGGAVRQLRDAQKTAKGVSLYSRYVNRPVGRVLAAGAYRVGLTPNQVTLVSAVFSGAAIAALALGRPSWPLAVAVWAGLVVGFAFDSADGQLARLLRAGSPAGEWLDHVVDCAKITAVHAAVLITFYRHFDLPGDGWLLLPLGFQLAAVMIFFGGLLTDKLTPKAPRPAPGTPAPPAPSRLRAVALLPVDYGVFCLVFLLLGSERAFRTAYLALFAVHAVFLAAFLTKWFRELRRI
jgi:hypothetical protein